MPNEHTSKTVLDLGIAIASAGACDNNGQTKKSVDERTFTAFFDQNADSGLELWNTSNHLVKKTKLRHLFWMLPHSKLHLALDVTITMMLSTGEDSFNARVWKWIDATASQRSNFI